MKRYINIDEFKLPCTPGDCYECIFFSLDKCIMKEHINNAPPANVIEVTDKSIESLVKGLEILGDTKYYANVVRCKDCIYQEHCHETVAHTRYHAGFIEHWSETIEWCSRGKHKGGDAE